AGTRPQSGNNAGYANRNQNPSNAGAAAGAGYANRNQNPSNAGAAAGAGYANRNQGPSNAGAAAAGAGYANRNHGPSNAGAAAPPEPPVADQATAAFNQAREAFKAGDYGNARQLVQRALTQMPNDTTLHEFLALVLFAQGQYEQAAAPLYAVLAVGPGWDWTTLSGMYPDVATYTGQLRNLEAFNNANPRSAQARFVL